MTQTGRRLSSRASTFDRNRALQSGLDRLRAGRISSALVEIVLLLLWTLFITHPYLDLSSTVVPSGRQFLTDIQSNYFWIHLRDCGLCALWDGDTRGGAPALADPYGSMLYPLVSIPTVLFGALSGSKIALVSAFFLAGLGQWWLGRVLRTGPVARVWSAAIAVAGGELAADMEAGLFSLVISYAACALAIPALISFVESPSRRAAATLGAVAGLALLSGQGYLQVALVLTLPIALVLAPWQGTALAHLGRRSLLAGGVALLWAAPLLVPFAFVGSQFAKGQDGTFGGAQPFGFVPLNLVIGDPAYYTSNALEKLPFPFMYATYVGWIPVLFALWGMVGARNHRERRRILYLILLTLALFWLASAAPLIWLYAHLPPGSLRNEVAGLRTISLVASLAITPVLGLAGLGLDRLLRAVDHAWLDWRSWRVHGVRWVAQHPRLLLLAPLIVVLAIALNDVRTFSARYISDTPIAPEVLAQVDALQTPDLQWVDTPFGELFYLAPSLDAGLKIASAWRAYDWNGRPPPDPALFEAPSNTALPPGSQQIDTIDGVALFSAPPGREYAAITSANERRTVCEAHGTGGDIEVSCDAPAPGVLTVLENSWPGWSASLDGQSLGLTSGRWLAADVPAGSWTVQFRYRPLDAYIGILLGIVGLLLAAYLWLPPRQQAALYTAVEPYARVIRRRAMRAWSTATGRIREPGAQVNAAGGDRMRLAGRPPGARRRGP